MTKPTPQAKDETAGAIWERDELTDEQLEEVRGGSAFLSGALTTQQPASPWLDPGDGNANGFVMRDTIIIRTGGH